jgi:NitT/TauT family transport system substrate-binding protein
MTRNPIRFFALAAILSILVGLPVTGAEIKIRMATATQEAVNAGTLKMIEVLKTKGINVSMIEHSGGAKSTQAVLAGQVEFGMGGADEVMAAVANGAPVQAFSPAMQPRINYVIVAREGISSIADLKGKRFGISGTAGFDNILSRIAMTRSGVNPNDVLWTQIGGSSARSQALAAGRVDAVTVFLPNWVDLSSKGDFVRLVDLAELFPTLTQSVFVARTDWIKQNPQVCTAIIEAVIETQGWAHDNKEEWIDMAMGFLKARDRESIAQTYDDFKKMGMFAVDGGLSRSGSIELGRLLVQSGDLAAELPLEKWMATDILAPYLLD